MNRLVRPDGFGAWRSTTLPTNPERFWRGCFRRCCGECDYDTGAAWVG
jgi:hypothetical protein